jgi:CelD/BcsL family acetyltransferase involved in cellulose biosynthesis
MAEVEVTWHRSPREIERLAPEWIELFEDVAPGNPFASPVWLMTWARHFTRPEELYFISVRAEGRLVAVAPLYRRGYRLAGLTGLRRVRLLGTGRHTALTELAQILTRPGFERKALRAITAELVGKRDEWDWAELALPPEQGWVEPDWFGSKDKAFAVHTNSVACVVLPLPGSWQELHRGLKRNVRESIRRSRNRIDRSGEPWSVEFQRCPEDLAQGIEPLIELHHARAAMEGKPLHPDYFVTASHRAFLAQVAPQMARGGQLEVALLKVRDKPIAGLLVLRSEGQLFFSFSGIDPEWWDAGPMTLLQAECIRDAIERGDRSVNFSVGPSVAKLRWSENLEVHSIFAVVSGSRRSRMAFGTYWAARAVAMVARAGKQGRPQRVTTDETHELPGGWDELDLSGLSYGRERVTPVEQGVNGDEAQGERAEWSKRP